MTLLGYFVKNFRCNVMKLTDVKIGHRYFSLSTCCNQSLAPLNYINGERVYPAGSDSFNLIEPATGKSLGVVKCSGNEDITKAVSASASAFDKWSALSGSERAQVLRRAAEIVRLRQDEIAKWDSVDTGEHEGIFQD